MTVMMVPPIDEEPWPTLGPDVCAWITAELCHGPGDLLGDDVQLSEEDRFWLWRMYEVYPETRDRRKNRVIVKEPHPQAGLRRFQRCVLSLRKGSAKTEKAAWIAAAELHPDAPVRCRGWETRRGVRVPIGSGVTDPYIPMISYTEEQTEELAYGALRRILEESRVARDFDIGLERIIRLNGDGKAEAVSASPNARDGARTTFQHADETHRFTLESQQRGWRVMLANLAKRPLADPWALETTTAPEPGTGSTAETTMQYAEDVRKREGTSRLFFYHRQASDKHKIETDKGLRAAIIEASGPYIAKWSSVDRIAAMFREPNADLSYLERVWLNRPVQAAAVAFDILRWRALVRPGYVVPDRASIAVGFDGGRFEDSTAIEGTEIETGHQWRLGLWEKPKDWDQVHPHQPWETPAAEVDGVVADLFERYNVIRMYCDPPKWESWIATWAGRYGEKRVIEWWTNRRKPMAYALRAYVGAMTAGELTHDGDRDMELHLANSRKLYTNLVDEQSVPLWILRKERPDSPKKIDLAMAGCLSWTARNDALAEGYGQSRSPWLVATA